VISVTLGRSQPAAAAPAEAGKPRRTRDSLPIKLLKLWARWAARSTIVGRSRSRSDPTAGRLTRSDVDRLLGAAWANFDRLAPELPHEPTLGSRQNVQLACLTLSMLEALTSDGIERGYAIELVGDVCWKIYAQWGQIPRLVTRLLTRDRVKRMRISVEMFLRYPFNRPGYRFDDVAEPRGRGFDILRCPVAEYLAAHDASDLAVATWCNLDFQLARMWGGELERHGTLAAGAERCDFRFRAHSPKPGATGYEAS
jgi:L-2-amino-thiazoline-4-carboxylic acid hydrolase